MQQLSADALVRDLWERPRWRPDDLGARLPDSPHAVSACLPTWRNNVGYEEGDPRVHQRLSTGYPRFVFNALCRQLFAECERRVAGPGQRVLAFPSPAAAERTACFIRQRTGQPAVVAELNDWGIATLCFPESAADAAREAWQHFGEGISSRQAEAILSGRTAEDGTSPRRALRNRLAAIYGVEASNVFLYPTGMSALFAVHRVLRALFPTRKTIQFGFPYVDTLKIQQKVGRGVHLFPRGDAAELGAVQELLGREPVGGLFTEFPSNPLLSTPDLDALGEWARRCEFPLIVDDTLSTPANVDLLASADVVATSLTKFFSGVGDVTAGALILNPQSPWHGEVRSRLDRDHEDLLWAEDAQVLERHSRDFASRMQRINATAERLVEWLSRQPQVARVYHPSTAPSGNVYRCFMRSKGGFGGLFSFELNDPPQTAPTVFDRLRVSKGPNLGTSYTLACPYTILAHYGELEFAESCGVSRYLIRVSVGLEDFDDLRDRFAEALSQAEV